MKRRLRKKKHLGEFQRWGAEIVIGSTEKDVDAFAAAVIEVVERHDCRLGGRTLKG